MLRSILHDPEVYPDPHTFNPSRFLMDTPEGKKINPAVPDSDAAFGFGRRFVENILVKYHFLMLFRICAGRFFAQNSLFIIVTNVLASFNISPPLDASGKPMHLDAEITSGLLS